LNIFSPKTPIVILVNAPPESGSIVNMPLHTSDLVDRHRDFEKRLRYKIEYRRLQVIWPPHLDYGNVILAHALKNIELLQDRFVTSWDAERYPYHELKDRILIRATQSFRNLDDKPQTAGQKDLLDRIDVIKTASATLDDLYRKKMKKNERAHLECDHKRYDNMTARGSRPTMPLVRRVTDGGCRPEAERGLPRRANPPDGLIDGLSAVMGEKLPSEEKAAEEVPLIPRQEVTTTNKQLSVEDTLTKIEAWADDWLAGELVTDEDWDSFVNCLDRP